jgi:hypothetical protein
VNLKQYFGNALPTLATTPFQFVILNAPILAQRQCDPRPFQEHFNENPVVVFENIGKDSLLVVPCLKSINETNMTHISQFHRFQSKELIFELWQTLGYSILERIKNEKNDKQKFWISTSEMGVSWLHIRIDNVPKYYNWNEYKSN